MARNFREAYGGKGSDMAVQAGRLGAPVNFVGCVGDDDFGRAFIKLMHEEKVNTDLLNVRSELATGAGFIIKDRSGHNVITIDIGANQLFSPGDVDRAASRMNNGSVVLIQLEIPLGTALHAAKVGRAAGSTVIFNPAPAHDLRQYDLSCVDYLTPNETEARVCLGLRAGRSHARCRDRPPAVGAGVPHGPHDVGGARLPYRDAGRRDRGAGLSFSQRGGQ